MPHMPLLISLPHLHGSVDVMLLPRSKIGAASIMAVHSAHQQYPKPASPHHPSSALNAILSINAGLSSQLAAQAVLPGLEDLHDVHTEQLVRTLSARQTNT